MPSSTSRPRTSRKVIRRMVTTTSFWPASTDHVSVDTHSGETNSKWVPFWNDLSNVISSCVRGQSSRSGGSLGAAATWVALSSMIRCLQHILRTEIDDGHEISIHLQSGKVLLNGRYITSADLLKQESAPPQSEEIGSDLTVCRTLTSPRLCSRPNGCEWTGRGYCPLYTPSVCSPQSLPTLSDVDSASILSELKKSTKE